MANILYARTSTLDQNLDRQLVGDYDKVFTDQVSGSLTSREGLDAMFEYVREGDMVSVHHTDRITRGGVTDMDALLSKFKALGVHLKFGNLPDTIYADQPMSSSNQFMLDLMASLDRQQRGKIREVCADGIAVAKAKDVVARAEGRFEDVLYKGRKASVDVEKLRQAILDTMSYPNLIKQTEAVNKGHIKVSKTRLYKEMVAMRKEGIL